MAGEIRPRLPRQVFPIFPTGRLAQSVLRLTIVVSAKQIEERDSVTAISQLDAEQGVNRFF
jgi:hypothetical protein